MSTWHKNTPDTISIIDTYKAWRNNDPWGMLAQGMATTGFVLGFTSDAIVFVNAVFYGSLMTESALVGWLSLVAFGLVVAGFVLYWLIADTPLEVFLNNSPFGQDKDNAEDEHALWHHWPALALERLAELLNTPQITFRRDTRVAYTSTEYWNCEVMLKIHTPGWAPGRSILDHSLSWRPRGTDDWRPLNLQTNQCLADGFTLPGIDWQYTEVDEAKEGASHSVYLQYRSLYSLLQAAQMIELKFSVRYFPKGKEEPFSRAIPEVLVLPKPSRHPAQGFKAEGAPWDDHIIRLGAPWPAEEIPLPDSGQPEIDLRTKQPVRRN